MVIFKKIRIANYIYQQNEEMKIQHNKEINKTNGYILIKFSKNIMKIIDFKYRYTGNQRNVCCTMGG